MGGDGGGGELDRVEIPGGSAGPDVQVFSGAGRVLAKHFPLTFIQLLQQAQLGIGRPAGGSLAEGKDNTIGDSGGAGKAQHPLAESAGGFNELRVIEQDQRLQRSAGRLAADRANFTTRSVEDCHVGGRRGPPPERVQAATVKALSLVGNVDRQEGILLAPETGRLVRLRRRAADLVDEQAPGSQSRIAEHLGRQAPAGSASQEEVVRIALAELRRRDRGLAIGGRKDDLLAERLDVPARGDEVTSQPVE